MWQYLKQCYVPPKEKEKDEKITQINGKLLVSLGPKDPSKAVKKADFLNVSLW